VLDEPLKFRDHAMDAMRYAVHTHTGGRFITLRDLREAKVTPLSSVAATEGF
jgi:hypothetical protein